MAWVIIGLGNPGEEYKTTRHNTGRMAVEFFAKKNDASEWRDDKKAIATVAEAPVAGKNASLVLPNTYMNKSGTSAARYVKSVKAAEQLIVAYDDLDLPLGRIKISFDRGSGGHKGIESVTRAVKTKKFARIRIGISPSTASGKTKKPQGEADVEKFILGKFTPSQMDELKKVFKAVAEAIECIASEGREVAMTRFN